MKLLIFIDISDVPYTKEKSMTKDPEKKCDIYIFTITFFSTLKVPN